MTAAAACPGCNATIYWALTKNDKRMPVDRAPHPDGNVLLWEDRGTLRARVLGVEEAAREAEPLRQSHFATCTRPDKMKAKRRRGRRRR